MALQEIYRQIAQAPLLDEVRTWIEQHEGNAPQALRLRGAAGSLPAFVLHHLRQETSAPLLCLMPDEDAAAYLFSDLDQLADGAGKELLHFPATGRTPYDEEEITDSAPLITRADVLQQLSEAPSEFAGLVVTSAPALCEKVPPPDAVQQETTTVALGQEIAPEALTGRLTGQGFVRVEFVEAPGELALRGGILDVFPFAGPYPVRIEFFGDEVDAIREFDPHTQRSVSRRRTARLVPNLERGAGAAHVTLFDYLPEQARLTTFDEARCVEAAEALFEEAEERFADGVGAHPKGTSFRAQRAAPLRENGQNEHGQNETAALPPEARHLSGARLAEALAARPRLLFGAFTGQAGAEALSWDGRPQPAFGGSLDLLRERLAENRADGLRTYLLCDSQGQASRLRDLLEDDIDQGRARLAVESLHEGFELAAQGVAVYTDHQLFGRYHRPSTRKRHRRQGGLNVRELQNLTPGDFVVHVDYGIGKFAGMKKIEVRGNEQEAVRLNFAGGDVLYVNTSALYKLGKYTGKEGHQPRLTRLGSDQWEKAKARAKQGVKDIARDLITLYAERKASQGHAFPPDTVWQREMEASFQFEDTPDQSAASEAVKADMEAPVPMDRLVCGDVGFGKTEVAVRAAFKAAQDGRQVAVLCPTTILAAQHYETFSRRLEKYPVHVDVISRFRTAAEQKEILERLKNGQIDILIGTHRITSKDIKFNNLGLVIIDEEQRFGVAVKERLRKLRAEVDTLTLTATPIPRTLQFSLMGARDLSIIATPPPNRQPIVTEIHTFDRDLIRDAILYETSRGGQVFFIHNRVKNIQEIAEMLRALAPGARIRVGHGQMPSKELEQVMVGFIEREFDVLVSTSIIENGLDIANANTMVIHRADRFGLSETHQLRGRVGRSERKAFCYLLVPSVHSLTREGRQRLKAVEEFSDLGSGFSLAMRDLDIRGAGTLLNAEQSGFVEDVGFETYHRILDEAVRELRHEEFSDTFEGAAPPMPGETTVDVEADALLPPDYVSNNTERLNLYRRISEAGTEEALEALRAELEDRFGALPPEAAHLLSAAALRLLAQPLRLPKVLYKNERLFLSLPGEQADPYFYEEVFHPLLERLTHLERRYVLKEGKALRAIIQDVPTLAEAQAVMERLAAEALPTHQYEPV